LILRLPGSEIMADLPPPKPDPTVEQATAPGATKVPEESATATVTSEATQEKPAASASSVAETVTNAAATATAAVKDNVFSMFGGGPKKEKREEVDDVDEPSGGSKGKAAEVRHFPLFSNFES
jgi:Ran-binding protein 1